MTTNKTNFNLRGVILAWTIFTTTFTWTPSMRLFFKPEIETSVIAGTTLDKSSGQFWFLPLLAVVILFMFYIEGRGRMRGLFHAMLMLWHLPLTLMFLYFGIRGGTDATFVGAAWGWKVPFLLLAIPFTIGSILAVLLVVKERRGQLPIMVVAWENINLRLLVIAVALFPLIFILFYFGKGYNHFSLAAIITSIIQWILLAEALGYKSSNKTEATTKDKLTR